MSRLVSLAALSLVAGLGASSPARGQESSLGSVSFPNSGAQEAQDSFHRGLALLHSFEFGDARGAFREAQEIDPKFAMAYWGEAMAWNYPLWFTQYREEALQALRRFAPTPEERQARTPTERERLWMAAVEELYGEGDKQTRDDRYEAAMARIHRRYPTDPEAASFHALAILGSAHQGRDHRKYMRAGTIALQVLAAHPKHPGAAHYVIHSFDDPDHAVLGLEAARTYSAIAPEAAHAQHMTTHIFLALGMWDDVVRANERADAVSDARSAARGGGGSSCGHYNEWLLYGYLMQERQEKAMSLLRECGEESASDAGRISSFADMRSRYLLDTERWSGGALDIPVDLSDSPGASLTDAFIRGLAAARTGDAEGVQTWLDRLRELRPAVEADMAAEGLTEATYVQRPAILELQLQGLLREAERKSADAVAYYSEAARLEESLPHAYGPPVIEKSSHELLGEVLLPGDATTAARALRMAVERAPGRIPTLRRLQSAALGAGDEDLAAWAGSELSARTGQGGVDR